MFKLLFLLPVLILAGCVDGMAPITKGTVIDDGLFLGKYTVVQKETQGHTWPLSAGQLEKLSAWLKFHASGWHPVLVSPPPPSYSVILFHSNNVRTQIDLYSINESWRHAIRMTHWDATGKFLGSEIENLPSKDIDNLKQQLSGMESAQDEG
ncbi:hypothetical protein ACO0LO_05750 [Undibacterium sp. TJN25]|uniref:hypothetical protein n=1 Tax=Undibacterium sp. TJN25 TaxID=3413056 RepID=UPI003BF4048C